MQRLVAANMSTVFILVLIVLRIFHLMYWLVVVCYSQLLSFVFRFCLFFFRSSCVFLLSLVLIDTVVMDSLNASSPSESFSSRCGSMCSFMQYISIYGQCLDAGRLGTMRTVGDQPLIYDCLFDRYGDTVVGASTRYWHHSGDRGASSARCVQE